MYYYPRRYGCYNISISLRIHIDQPGFLAMYHGFCCQCSWRFFEWVIPDSSKGWSIVAKPLGWVKAELIFSKERPRARREQYCWWKNSCTTSDLWNHVNNWISHLSTGAGFQPSTVCCFQSYLIPWRLNSKTFRGWPWPRFLISQVAIHWLWVDQTCQDFM